MLTRSDIEADLKKLGGEMATLMCDNDRLRVVNAQMLEALTYVLPILRDAIPASVSFDWTRGGLAKVQGAIADAERDA